MARRIFRIIMALSVLAGVLLYSFREGQSPSFMIVASTFAFLALSLGVHGLIAHSLHPRFKGDIIVYPIWMWALWAVLFLLFVFFLIPLFCPDFSVFS
ncbi:MAG: hypothetical protein P8Z38_03140 [Robiginitalea sp.]|jgi:hypothetical protein